jgi:hypothetical protein
VPHFSPLRDKNLQVAEVMIINPFFFLPLRTCSAAQGLSDPRKNHALMEKIVAPVAVNSAEFPKMPETAPRRALSAHNECLWLIICLHTIPGIMGRIVAHRASKWFI